MDINQKLRQRRIKIELEKKHKKAAVMKNYNRDLKSNQTTNMSNIKDLIEKYERTEKFSKETDKKIASIVEEKKPIFEKKQIQSSEPKKDQIKLKMNKFNSKEEFQKNKKIQYKKLNQKNSKGQPILKNKIEYLFNKIKAKKNIN